MGKRRLVDATKSKEMPGEVIFPLTHAWKMECIMAGINALTQVSPRKISAVHSMYIWDSQDKYDKTWLKVFTHNGNVFVCNKIKSKSTLFINVVRHWRDHP